MTLRWITGAAEKSPEKVGKWCVGSLIPIVHEQEARVLADVFFVLPYAFLDYFVEKEKDFLKGGGELVVSTPEFKVI